MIVLRRTQKLATVLPASTSTEPVPTSETALGDWYVNKFVVDRKRLLLLVSARSLLPILIPARDVRSLPERLPKLVEQRLTRLGVQHPWIAAEVNAMSPVVVAKTSSRSVVGILVDFAFMAPYHLEAGNWDETTLPFVEARLAKTPCFAGRRDEDTVFPEQATAKLLASRWEAGST
jgi:hypothetical protein